MSLEILNSTTILNFVNDEAAFNATVRRRFAELDIDGDGLLSYEEMRRELESLSVLDLTDESGPDEHDRPGKKAELYRRLFEQYDRDSDGAVGPDEYVAETREMMVAIGTGLGFMPFHMLLAHDSLLKKAVDHELDSGL